MSLAHLPTNFSTIAQRPARRTHLERHRERRLVDEAAARRVDEEGAGPHLLDRVLVDEVVVVLVEGAVQRDAVGLEEQVLQRVDALEAERLLDPVRQVRVIKYDVEPEGLRPQSHRRTDATCEAQEL